MNVIIKKRQIIMSALVLALGSAVFVNWYFTRPGDQIQVQGQQDTTSNYSVVGEAKYVNAESESTTKTVTQASDADDKLAVSRAERKQAHDDAFNKLRSVINDSASSKTAVDTATKQLAELTRIIKLEGDIDALVENKCGIDCITAIGNDSVQLACEKGGLDSTSILQIKEIVIKHTGISSENITIFEAK